MRLNGAFKAGIALVMGCCLLGCDDEEIAKSAVAMKQVRAELEMSSMTGAPEELVRIAKYYRSVTEFASLVRRNPGMRDALRRYVRKVPSMEICNQFLVTKAIHKKVLARCSIGKIFVCSDEVRFYPIVLERLLGEIKMSHILNNEQCTGEGAWSR